MVYYKFYNDTSNYYFAYAYKLSVRSLKKICEGLHTFSWDEVGEAEYNDFTRRKVRWN